MAITTVLKLADLTNDQRYVDIANQALAQMPGMMARYPLGFGQWLQALAYAPSKPREIAIVGDPDSADTQVLLNVVRDGYRPFQVTALGSPDRDAALPLLWDRGLVDGQSPVPWAGGLCLPRFCLPGADYGTGGTAGAVRAPMNFWSIEHATRCR
jgi:uncharacterized protein YyaL (SSP411 family)